MAWNPCSLCRGITIHFALEWLFSLRGIRSLGIQIVEIREGARCEERLAYMANGPFHATFFVSPVHRHRTRLEPVMPGKCEQPRVEADRVTLTLKHSTLEVVVQDDLPEPAPVGDGADMATQEVLHPGIEEEAQIDVARVREHHHEGHQSSPCPTNFHVTKVPPVALDFFPRQRAKTQECLGRRTRTALRDQVPEVVRRALVAALAYHRVQAAGRQRRELLQCLPDERQVRLNH